MGSDRNSYGYGYVVATREKTAMFYLRIVLLFTLHTLLIEIVCCLQLNTGGCRGWNPEGGLIVIDAVGLTVYVSCCNVRIYFHSVHSDGLITEALFVNSPAVVVVSRQMPRDGLSWGQMNAEDPGRDRAQQG